MGQYLKNDLSWIFKYVGNKWDLALTDLLSGRLAERTTGR